MKEFIQRMYQAIQEGNVELFDDIEDGVKRGDIELSTEDIVPLCKLIITDSEYIEYSQIIEIARMTLWAVEKNIKEGFEELVKGLEEIYNEGKKDTWKNWYGSGYEEFIDRYIGMTILRYKEEDMVLFGKSISKSCSTDFKSVMLKILKRTMAREEEKEGYVMKGKILEDNIKL
ncbi:MAG: hypothetical protein HDR21_05035 [Lachnospiraceae bacterium]|nr:hypothetical protein [Lachnospiraceae bacterium]MBD5482377.1 hypothetical protein [Lachnospiraceae bacterium]